MSNYLKLLIYIGTLVVIILYTIGREVPYLSFLCIIKRIRFSKEHEEKSTREEDWEFVGD